MNKNELASAFERLSTEWTDAHLSVLGKLDVFVGICDNELKPLFVNSNGRRMCGIDEKTPVPATILYFFRAEDRDFILNEFLPAVRRNGQAEVEIPFIHQQTGEQIWMN